MRTPFVAVLASFALLLPIAMACSSSDASSTTEQSGDGGGTQDPDTTDEEDSSTSGDAAGTGKDAGRDVSQSDANANDAGADADADAQEPDPACADRATYNECTVCCSEHHAQGYDTLDQTARNCACNGVGAPGGTAPCATACAKATCAATPVEPTPGDACDLCFRAAIRSGGACSTKINTTCKATPDCTAFLTCGQTYCTGK
ncbi:hypothetical protein [Labilithrix luteola]|nr:hypothetical protein [Labilithrix luteola]